MLNSSWLNFMWWLLFVNGNYGCLHQIIIYCYCLLFKPYLHVLRASSFQMKWLKTQKSQLAGYQALWAWTLAFVMTNNVFHYCLSAIVSTRDIFADICSLPTQCTLVKRKLLDISRIEGTALYLFPWLLACLFLFLCIMLGMSQLGAWSEPRHVWTDRLASGLV